MIRVVSFDVGGTFIAPWPSVGEMYRGEAVRLGLGEPAAGEVDAAFRRVWKRETSEGRFDYSLGAWEGVVRGTFEGLISNPGSGALFEAVYRRFAEASAWRLYDDVRGCLEEVRRRGVRCGVISNWDERLRPMLGQLGLGGVLEWCLVSKEVGYHKPAAGIFEAFCRAAGVSSREVLHVGDGWREDVEGAVGAGMRAVWLDRSRGPGVEKWGVNRVGTLAELGAILDQLR